jgi:hypothetical protein
MRVRKARARFEKRARIRDFAAFLARRWMLSKSGDTVSATVVFVFPHRPNIGGAE